MRLTHEQKQIAEAIQENLLDHLRIFYQQGDHDKSMHHLNIACELTQTLESALTKAGEAIVHSVIMVKNRGEDRRHPFYSNPHAIEDFLKIIGVGVPQDRLEQIRKNKIDPAREWQDSLVTFRNSKNQELRIRFNYLGCECAKHNGIVYRWSFGIDASSITTTGTGHLAFKVLFDEQEFATVHRCRTFLRDARDAYEGIWDYVKEDLTKNPDLGITLPKTGIGFVVIGA